MLDITLFVLEILESLIRNGATVVAFTLCEFAQKEHVTILLEDDGLDLQSCCPRDRWRSAELRRDSFRRKAERLGVQISFGSSRLGGSRTAIRASLSEFRGEIAADLSAMLSSVVCTRPDFDLRLKFDFGDSETSVSVHEIARQFPHGEVYGLTLARRVHDQIRSEFDKMERMQSEPGFVSGKDDLL